MKQVLINCFAGLYGLLQDPAGILCLLSLAAVSTLAMHGKVGDAAVVSCFTLIPSLAVLMKHKAFQEDKS